MVGQERNFMEMLQGRWQQGKFVCVGLDSEYEKIPKTENEAQRILTQDIIFWFNRCIVETTSDLVCAYKPNIAFYEMFGAIGMTALKSTIEFIHAVSSSVPVILDSKRADIGNTNNGYVKMAFEYFDADAVTVHPYLGQEALKPFLDRKEKGIIVLCRTSNPGAGEFQDLIVEADDGFQCPLYQCVAVHVAHEWNKKGNCGLVVGATYPEELGEVRKLVGDMPILIPAIGAQGGDLEKSVLAGKDSRNQGMIINSSRGIIFASKGPDFAAAARRETQKLHDAITTCLQKGGAEW